MPRRSRSSINSRPAAQLQSTRAGIRPPDHANSTSEGAVKVPVYPDEQYIAKAFAFDFPRASGRDHDPWGKFAMNVLPLPMADKWLSARLPRLALSQQR
jgi:hypothetical protein